MYVLVTTSRFDRRIFKFSRAHPELKKQLARTLRDLEADPFQPHLRLHALKGQESFLQVQTQQTCRMMDCEDVDLLADQSIYDAVGAMNHLSDGRVFDFRHHRCDQSLYDQFGHLWKVLRDELANSLSVADGSASPDERGHPRS